MIHDRARCREVSRRIRDDLIHLGIVDDRTEVSHGRCRPRRGPIRYGGPPGGRLRAVRDARCRCHSGERSPARPGPMRTVRAPMSAALPRLATAVAAAGLMLAAEEPARDGHAACDLRPRRAQRDALFRGGRVEFGYLGGRVADRALERPHLERGAGREDREVRSEPVPRGCQVRDVGVGCRLLRHDHVPAPGHRALERAALERAVKSRRPGQLAERPRRSDRIIRVQGVGRKRLPVEGPHHPAHRALERARMEGAGKPGPEPAGRRTGRGNGAVGEERMGRRHGPRRLGPTDAHRVLERARLARSAERQPAARTSCSA
jgi:hypothetical protein